MKIIISKYNFNNLLQRLKQCCLGACVVKYFTCIEFQMPAMKLKLQNT